MHSARRYRKPFKYTLYQLKSRTFLLLVLFAFTAIQHTVSAQTSKPALRYIVSMPKPDTHKFHMILFANGLSQDTLHLKMPNWMPGYYQLMNYANDVENMSAFDENGQKIDLKKVNSNTWRIIGVKNKTFILNYDVKAEKQFVANSFLDDTHGYIVPANNFLYINGMLNLPVSVKIISNPQWNKIATSLEPTSGMPDEFTAPDFDILYDSPILIGELDELPSFKVKGIEHRFIGYKIGHFNRKLFIGNLKKVVEAAVSIIGDIPYKQYTFLAIGPGRGGIEHLNNSTLSFDGNEINTNEDMNRTMNFIGHEYFHNYNVKRIRPFELGPFDYDKENKTNLLWVSEGLTVYYEYILAKRAGLVDEKAFFADFEGNINTVENNPGRLFQSLSQCSYNTWNEGPFGAQGEEKGKTISYYEKGPVVGLLLDLSIRNATLGKKSLDDVMRLLYWRYYKTLQRGFTDAEFQVACESIAGVPLTKVFEYVYTTNELDYNKYLGYAGLKLVKQVSPTPNNSAAVKLVITRIENPDASQKAVLRSWLGD